MTKYITALFALTAMLVAAQPAKAVEGITETGWSQRCAAGKDGNQQCEIYDASTIKQGGALVLELSVGYPPGQTTPRAAIKAPLNIWLEPGIAMKIGDQKETPFRFHSCNEQGCMAYFNVDDKTLATMKKGGTASFAFKSIDAQQIKVDLSLSGFGKAFDGLKK